MSLIKIRYTWGAPIHDVNLHTQKRINSKFPEIKMKLFKYLL